MKQSCKDLLCEENKYKIKYVLHATAFIWILYLGVFFHELGHAVTVLALGGTLREFVVMWNITGYVKWTWENISPETIPRVITLVNVSGGIAAALFFMMLSYKSKWFVVPALFCLLDGFGEAMCMAGTRWTASNIMGILVVAICMGLFWKFETQYQLNKGR